MLASSHDNITSKLPINIKIAEKQDQYNTIKANVQKGLVSYAFDLDDHDLIKVISSRRIYVSLMTFDNSVQPISIEVDEEDFHHAHDFNMDYLKNVSYVSPVQDDKVKEMLANDPITLAVNECNNLLAKFGLKVNRLDAVTKEDYKRPHVLLKNKIYTSETIEEVQKYKKEVK